VIKPVENSLIIRLNYPEKKDFLTEIGKILIMIRMRVRKSIKLNVLR